jgi:hypothetical protein
MKGQYILDTDASNNGIGAVLSQVQEERVIEYYSKVLSKPERNYCLTRKELLVIVNAVGISINTCTVNISKFELIMRR